MTEQCGCGCCGAPAKPEKKVEKPPVKKTGK